MTHVARIVILALLPLAVLHPGARHRPGPVYLRGIAENVTGSGFRLLTTHHGTFQVAIAADTAITEKGSRVRLVSGDHVGVHGFVSARTLRAIYVHVYSTRPKPFSLRGTVAAVTGRSVTIRGTAGSTTLAVTAATTILIGSMPGTIRAVRVGDRVEARAEVTGGQTVALHIHVYRHKVRGMNVQLKGTVAALGTAGFTLRGPAGTVHVGLTASTVIYVGAVTGTRRDLRVGQVVRVYACCRGGPLVAHSVHIERHAQRGAMVTVRGVVASLSTALLRLSSGVELTLTSSTRYEVGITAVPRQGVRVGDHVSIRAARHGTALVAVRVHVYASFRRPRTVRGVVTRAGGGRLSVLDRGTTYAVVAALHAAITLNGRPAAVGSLRVGDHIRAVGHLQGSTLTAQVIAARRLPPHLTTVRGTLVSAHGSRLTIRDSSGIAHRVSLGRRVMPTWDGHAAPAAVLFPGVHMDARGVLHGATLVASRVTVIVAARTVTGRIARLSSRAVTLEVRHVRIDLPNTARIRDGGRTVSPSALRVGTEVQVTGFAVASRRVRADTVTVQHPVLDVSGVVASVVPLTLRTTSGEQYVLVPGDGVTVVTEHTLLPVPPGELTAGTPIHAHGTLRTNGTLATDLVQVRLPSVTLRENVSAVAVDSLSLADGQRIAAGGAVVTQGSHALTLGDIVAGDDVTVEGYRGKDEILARRILVHRRLVGLDGVVASLTGDGFLVTVAGRQIDVIVTASTSQTVQPAVGVAVHVTGYQRGDGSVLATRLRAGTRHRPAVELACPRLSPSPC